MNKAKQIVALLLMKNHIEKHQNFPTILAKLLTNDLYALMGDDYDIKKVEEEKPHIKEVLNDLAFLLSHEQIKSRHAKAILEEAWTTDPYAWDISWFILDSKLFEEISLDGIIEEVIQEEPKAWDDFCNGKKKVIGRLIGCVMKKTKGKADPQEATELFEGKL